MCLDVSFMCVEVCKSWELVSSIDAIVKLLLIFCVALAAGGHY